MKTLLQNKANTAALQKAASQPSAKPGDKRSENELLTTLQEAIAPGRGNSHWLSFKEVGQLLDMAKTASPVDREALKSTLAAGMTSGNIGERPLALGGRAARALGAFCGVDAQTYMQVAPAGVQALMARTTGFAGTAQKNELVGGTRKSPSAAMAQTVASGLADVAEAAKTTSTPKDLTTLEGVRDFAQQTLALHLADRGIRAEDAGVELKFDRSQWTSKALNNPRGLEQSIEGAAAFLAQMVEDRGAGDLKLAVALTPKGDLHKTEGVDQDTLWVPTNKGVDAQQLRKDWDGGAFIKADNWWNPMDHMKAAKLRGLWKVVGNPVGVMRTRLRRTFGDVQGDLGKTLKGVLDKAGAVPTDELRQKAADVVRSFVGPDVKSAAGDNLRDTMLQKVATVDENVLVNFLGRWDANAADPGLVDDVSNFSLSATANRLKDSQLKIGLVNVDTYDAISVAPDSALARHGDMAVNDVELSGTRIGLVNVQSVDMVSVVPDLARMIFGGTSMERAANETGLL